MHVYVLTALEMGDLTLLSPLHVLMSTPLTDWITKGTCLDTTCKLAVEVVRCPLAWSKVGRAGVCQPQTTGTDPGRHQWSSPGVQCHTQGQGGCTNPWTRCRPLWTLSVWEDDVWYGTAPREGCRMPAQWDPVLLAETGSVGSSHWKRPRDTSILISESRQECPCHDCNAAYAIQQCFRK